MTSIHDLREAIALFVLRWMPSATGFAITAVSLFVLNAARAALTGPVSSLPGTQLSKWTDLPLRLTILTGRRAQYVHALHEKYGAVVRIGPREVDISDRTAARQIHRANSGFLKSSFYATGGRFQSMFSTRDPVFHAKRRRLLGGCFTEAALAKLEPTILNLAQTAVVKMGKESRAHGCVDVLKWWTLLAMDVIGQLSFGQSFDMVERGEKNQFAKDVASAGSILPLRTAFPTVLWLGSYLPFIPYLQDIGQSRQRIMAYQQERISRYLHLVEHGSEDTAKTFFATLVKGQSAELTPVDMMVEVQSYVTAGTDTTAVTLTYLIWAVCKNPAIQTRLTRELQAGPKVPSYKALRELPYLQCVVEEALRCYGAAPGSLPRDVPSGGSTLAGHYIPEGVVVSTQAYSLHRDPEAFPDPERFDPSRWESPTQQMKDAFCAFGTGPRGCIGVHLARMELCLAAALFFRAYPDAKISDKDGMSDMDMDLSISFLLMPRGHRCLVEVQ